MEVCGLTRHMFMSYWEALHSWSKHKVALAVVAQINLAEHPVAVLRLSYKERKQQAKTKSDTWRLERRTFHITSK
jgi:hypothetical protein